MASVEAEPGPVLETASGALRATGEAGVAVFRAVPYAAPPTGPLRFAPPAPMPPWRGVRDAVRHGPIAPQLPTTIIHVMGDVTAPQGEDCLSLTIWTPAADHALRPVLVWLHGGSYTSGAGSLGWYNGAHLSRNGNLVVVGVNYRLGALGFLCREGIASGNMGLLDQAAALQWIAAHIESFGGDPKRITLAGQSAGAHAIGWLGRLPEARATFRRAILQSGALFRPPSTPADMAPTAAVFLENLGIDPEASGARSRLQAVPVQRILEAQAAALAEGDRLGGARQAFRPVSAAGAPAGSPLPAIAGALAGADVMVGITANEMHAFIGKPGLPDHSEAFVADRLRAASGRADALAHYRPRYPGTSLRNLYCEVMTELDYGVVMTGLSDALSRAGAAVFGYVFAWAPPASRYKACHCIDLPFVFGNFEQWGEPGMLAGGSAAEMRELSALVQRAWISFVQDGIPAPDPALPWPRYEPPAREVIRFGRKIRVGRSYLL